MRPPDNSQLKAWIRNIDTGSQEVAQWNLIKIFINIYTLISPLMSKFLNKDFFGDPYWPQDFSADLNRLPDPEALQPPSAKKHN